MPAIGACFAAGQVPEPARLGSANLCILRIERQEQVRHRPRHDMLDTCLQSGLAERAVAGASVIGRYGHDANTDNIPGERGVFLLQAAGPVLC